MLDKVFDPRSFEGNFSFEVEASLRNPNAEPYMVLLPPPNVTGSLHIGHALCYTLQDVLARYKRMRGYDVLFQPGLDHAGIVTQLLVEKQLYESGIEKGTLTKDKLLKEIWYWKEQSGCTILDQLKILGISCDFSRLRFTLDEDSKRAVTKLFVKLFRDGLLRRGERMVSWDPVICTAVSDLEIIEKEVDGHMWHIKYMLEDKSDFIPVATTRPETIFGDAAVAVNPNDQRYRKFIGKNVRVPLTDRLIPVIADKHADMDKGTGAVKITPAHDFNDYEFTLYYQNGEEIELYDDELYNLKDYIEEKGYSKAGYYIAIDVIIIILCICINGIRKKIASDIDLFDKQMIEDVKEKSL